MSNPKELRQYDIDILQLENKHYDFHFEGGNEFFAALDQNLISKGAFKAKVGLDKSSTMLQLSFDIAGSYELICDRSLDPFEEPFQTKEKQILKFGDKAEQLSDEIEIIPWETATVNIARFLFDFIGLTVPMKKLHPRFRTAESDEEDEEATAEILVYSSAKPDENAEPEVDPRWEALKKLKNGSKGS
ncbi:hypothetical protein BWI93_21135 [Siphonobacter sp. BAB-5385]|uniref:YceD family protein n=1 Tax=unclassified Siphonobacter TaxID=2635712 RepID=UPI000B9EB98F|nr:MULTISPECIES: DUF177 domain-containing protein [unclassified Siphonobacter]OZI06315.1 hypothetical protein BWI93_21135 [Siphonobacter sp. BAB-5385]PMD96076.1 hypothetical protein BWI97_12280 [Siphonobacter sp. BAB-5405]